MDSQSFSPESDTQKQGVEWHKVTWYSQALAIILALLIFAVGFYLGSMRAHTLETAEQGGSSAGIPHDETLPHTHNDSHSSEIFSPDSVKQQHEHTQDTATDVSDPAAETTSGYLGSYTLTDPAYGTDVVVTVSGNTRTIVSNALPNHETGSFPNSGNPNSISAQHHTYTFPLSPIWTGTAKTVREPGVAINGIKFEPTTAEMVSCSTGERYQIEAFQDFADLGFDFNNAHVQPDGTYHYHGVPDSLISAFSSTDDLVHVGFARDGYLMYYSKSGAYTPSYQLSTDARSGSNCTYRNQSVAINNTSPDGTYVSDWEYIAGSGTLDECNGAVVNGTYAYFITDTYPYVSRCLKGSFTEDTPSGPPPGGVSGPPAGGPPPRR